jgi:hypothetical protein
MRYIRLTAVLLLLACGDGGTTPTSPSTPPTPVATSITLSPTSLRFSSIGATQQLSATVKDQNGATMSGASVSWARSSATKIFSGNGVSVATTCAESHKHDHLAIGEGGYWQKSLCLAGGLNQTQAYRMA